MTSRRRAPRARTPISNHNPATECRAELERQLAGWRSERDGHAADLAWHAAFDREAARARRGAENARVAALSAELPALAERVSAQESRVREAEAATELTFSYVMTWFSERNRAARARVAAERAALDTICAEHDRAAQALKDGSARVAALTAELDKHRTFRPEDATAAIARLDGRCRTLEPRLEEVRVLERAIDEQLRAPLAELQQLVDDRATLQEDIEDAQAFEDALNAARDKRESAEIHRACAARFDGKSSPRAVLHDRTRKLDRAERDIAARRERLDRDVAKQRGRLDPIARGATLAIDALVIDGNNLCYEDGAFIGLAALRPAARALSERFRLTIVFDAGIRRQLSMQDDDIQARFGTAARVHVVASRVAADETVLDTAEPPGIYVISNDRFAEFPDKAAVSARRLIRHEILNGQILIHDLSVRLPLEGRPAAHRSAT